MLCRANDECIKPVDTRGLCKSHYEKCRKGTWTDPDTEDLSQRACPGRGIGSCEEYVRTKHSGHINEYCDSCLEQKIKWLKSLSFPELVAYAESLLRASLRVPART